MCTKEKTIYVYGSRSPYSIETQYLGTVTVFINDSKEAIEKKVWAKFPDYDYYRD